MEAISKLIKLTGNSQPKSAISKSSLTTLFAFSMKLLPLNERSSPAVFHAKFHEAFYMVSHTTFAAKPGRCEPNDRYTTRVMD